MSSEVSITQWIRRLEAGDRDAAQAIWERYHRRLVGLARKQLGDTPRRAADEEDVVQNAFKSFYLCAEQGRFPKLENRHDLWQLLVLITARKALNQLQHEGRQKRGGTVVRRELAPAHVGRKSKHVGIEQIVGKEPTPEFCLMLAEGLGSLLDRLDDKTLRSIAIWKLEGYTNREISEKLTCSLSTVERKLRLIRRYWSHEGGNG